jgi:dTDP-4-dehydrorhamnose 3,5-epimerase
MEFIPTRLPDVVLIKPKVWNDARGFFLEVWNEREFQHAGLNVHFRQDNYSRSVRNVIRGMHYQLRQPQGKLVRCTRGAIFDVAVDLRRSSDTFGRWVGMELSEFNHHALWIPPGFAHGFCVISDRADVYYKASELYDAASDRVVLWNDPQLRIEWPISEAPLLSSRDAGAPSLQDAELFG